MTATIRKISSAGLGSIANRRERNRKTALMLVGVMIFLVAVSVVTVLVKR